MTFADVEASAKVEGVDDLELLRRVIVEDVTDPETVRAHSELVAVSI